MDFRGGIIEDLGLPPPNLVQLETPLCQVRDLVFDSSPVIPPKVAVFNGYSVVGYLTPLQLESSAADDEKQVASNHMHHIEALKLSIDKPLEVLYDALKSYDIVEVYDLSMKKLLAIVTISDFARRYPHIMTQYNHDE